MSSAHYEFLCKIMQVSRCITAPRPFNDGSLREPNNEGLKRTMAGEYSRELRGKMLAGLSASTVSKGVWPGYGLRRYAWFSVISAFQNRFSASAELK